MCNVQFIFDEPGQNDDLCFGKPAKPLCASASSNLAGLFMSCGRMTSYSQFIFDAPGQNDDITSNNTPQATLMGNRRKLKPGGYLFIGAG